MLLKHVFGLLRSQTQQGSMKCFQTPSSCLWGVQKPPWMWLSLTRAALCKQHSAAFFPSLEQRGNHHQHTVKNPKSCWHWNWWRAAKLNWKWVGKKTLKTNRMLWEKREHLLLKTPIWSRVDVNSPRKAPSLNRSGVSEVERWMFVGTGS